MAEPAEDSWNFFATPGSIFVIESGWDIGLANGGMLETKIIIGKGRTPEVRCIVERVLNESGIEVVRRMEPLPAGFRIASSLTLPWRRFENELLPPLNADGVLDATSYDRIVDQVAGQRRLPQKLPGGIYGRMVVAICPTEIAHGVPGISWMLLAQTGDKRQFVDKIDMLERWTARTLRAGKEERRSRSPAAAILRSRTTVVVGVGAVGAPVVLDLVRNGAAVVAMADGDLVNPGNGVRWPLGEAAWGRRKVDALASFVADNYADVVTPVMRREIGQIDPHSASSEEAEFAQALLTADVMIDCTASAEAERVLYGHACDVGVPLVSAYGTPTLEGGIVACFVPGGACPMCLLHHRNDGVLQGPPGEAGDDHAVALPGCAEATFSGASFDLSEISLEATRVVVRVLAGHSTKSFVETLAFDADGRPAWRFDPLERHPQCECA